MFKCDWGAHVATLGWVVRRGGGRERKKRRERERENWRMDVNMIGHTTYLPLQVFLLNHIQHEWPMTSVCTISESFEIRISVLLSVTCGCNYQKSSFAIRSFLLDDSVMLGFF